MPNIINWERAPVTSNVAVTIPLANYLAIEDDHGNVISCKDGAILSDFTVIERRSVAPAVEDDDLWAVHEYESRGLAMIAGDRIIHGTVMGKVVGIVVEFAWREYTPGSQDDEYRGKIETEGKYWRPVLVRWQKPGPRKTPEVVVKVGDAVSLDVISQTGDSAEVSVAVEKKHHVTKEEQLLYLVTHWDKWLYTGFEACPMSSEVLGCIDSDPFTKLHIITEDEWKNSREEYLKSLDEAYPGDTSHHVEVKTSTGDDFTDRVEMTDEQIAKFKETWTASHRLNKGGVVAVTEMTSAQLHGISGQHPTPLSVDILNQAIEAQRDRAATYDSPAGERSMGKTVAMFNILHGFDLTEEQGWQFMELLKMVRSSQGDFKLDNYVDGSSYASLAGDAAYHERGEE